jgi:predicted RNA binding protein YcfA (HicA-like mRNA interferase family)
MGTADVKYKVARRIVLKNGFRLARQSSSHEIYKRDNETLVLTTHEVCAVLWRRLVKEHSLRVV